MPRHQRDTIMQRTGLGHWALGTHVVKPPVPPAGSDGTALFLREPLIGAGMTPAMQVLQDQARSKAHHR